MNNKFITIQLEIIAKYEKMRLNCMHTTNMPTNTDKLNNGFTLKNVVKICESVLTNKTNARNVENPPFQTAGPIRVNVIRARPAKQQ